MRASARPVHTRLTPDATVREPSAPGLRAGYRLSFVLESDGLIRSVSEATGIENWPSEGYVGRTLGEVSAERAGPERGTLWDVRIERAMKATRPVQYLDSVPGSPVDATPSVGATVTPVRTPDGELQVIVVELEDRSAEGRSRLQLVTSEERFRGLAETLPQMVWESDGAGNARYFSSRWEAFSGRPLAQLLGRGYTDLVHPDDRTRMGDARDEGRSRRPISFRLRRHDGEYRWMEAYIEVIHDGAGQPVQAIGTAMDVTERRAAEDTARQRHEQLLGALSITGLGQYTLRLELGQVDADARVAEILHVDHDELSGPHGLDAFFRAIHTEDRPRARTACDVASSGGPDADLECRLSGGDLEAQPRWISIHGRLDPGTSGGARLIGLIEDVTERRAAEAARTRSQKREMLGTLVSGIAHDFNNVLGAILSNAAVARRELAAGDSVEQSLAEIERGAARAAELVRRVMDQGRDDDARLERLDVASIVSEACAALRPALPHGVELFQTIESGLPRISGSGAQLRQLVMNLVTNAGQALADGGGEIEVSVEADDARDDAPRRLRLSVRDDGVGIPDSVAPRVFDPYFTTRPAGAGAGLGLSVAQTIARAHRGTIELESVPGSHTTFTVLLPALGHPAVSLDHEAPPVPAVPAAIPPMVPEAPRPAGAQSPTRVLFVDDEPSLVRLAERALTAHGCTAVGFTDPEQALRAFAEAPEAFDALVTDLSMPVLDGLGLIEHVRELRPDLCVVLTSGFMTPEHHARATRLAVDAIVPKPCSMADLVEGLLRRQVGPGAEAT